MKTSRKVHIVSYVEDASPKLKKFTSIKAMDAWISNFKKNNPDPYTGYWINYSIKNTTLTDFVIHDEYEEFDK